MASDSGNKVPMHVKVPKAEKERWKEAARMERRSLTQYVRLACDDRAAKITPLHPSDYDNAA